MTNIEVIHMVQTILQQLDIKPTLNNMDILLRAQASLDNVCDALQVMADRKAQPEQPAEEAANE